MKKISFRKPAGCAVLLAVLLSGQESFSQDFGLWTGAEIEKKISKRFYAKGEVQVRFLDDISKPRTYLGEVGLEYGIGKKWSIEGYYRLIKRYKINKVTEEPYYQSRHRFYANLNYGTKLTSWLKFDYRLRYQNQFKDDASGVVADGSYLRNKFELSYRTKGWAKPYAAADIFYLLGTGIDQVRLKAGVNVSLSKAHRIGISVFTDYPLIEEIENGAIADISYKFKF